MRSDRIFLALVGIATALAVGGFFLSFAHPWTLGGDNKVELFPMTLEAYRGWTSGHVPGWSDKFWSGFPLLADPDSAALYLPHALPFWLTPDPHLRAYDVATALHAGILAAGTARLLLLLGAGRGPALVGVVLVLLGPTFHLWCATTMGLCGTVAWLPWVLVAAERLARRDESRVVGAAALGWIALGAQVLVGYPEIALYSGVVAGCWLLTRRAGLPFRARLARAVVLAAGAMALAAPQLVPALQYAQDTPRSGAVRVAAIASLWIGNPWSFVLPVGGLVESAPAFLGLATLVAAAIAVGARRPRAAFLAVVALAGFVLALGPQTPVHPLLHRLPPFDRFRTPYKFVIFAEIGLAWAATLGVDHLARRAARAGRILAALLAVAVVGERALYDARHLPRYGAARPGEATLAEITGTLESSGLRARVRPGAPPPRLLETVHGEVSPFSGHLPALYGLSLTKGATVALLSNRHWRLLTLRGLSRADLDLFGVEYVLTSQKTCPFYADRLGLRRLPDADGACLLENPSHPARYAFLPAARAVASEEEMIEAMPGRGAAVPVVAREGALPADPGAAAGRVEVLAYRPGRVRLATDSAVAALLLARESWAPGWEARVDGARVPIHPAGGILFALPVPAGRHEVELAYHTPGLATGCGVSAVWIALALVAAARERRRAELTLARARC